MESETVMAISSAVIAVFTALLFLWQKRQFNHDKEVHERQFEFDKKVQNANYKLALYDHRMKVYGAIEDCLAEFLRLGKPEVTAVLKLRYKARNASFMFPEEAFKFVDEIVEKGLKHNLAREIREPLRERAHNEEELTSEEEATKNSNHEIMVEIQRWFMDQISIDRLRKDFEPYLKLPDKL